MATKQAREGTVTVTVPGDLAAHFRQEVAQRIAAHGEELGNAYGDSAKTRGTHARLRVLTDLLDAVGWEGDEPIDAQIDARALAAVASSTLEGIDDQFIDAVETGTAVEA